MVCDTNLTFGELCVIGSDRFFLIGNMPKGLRRLDLQFSEDHLTHFGGLVLMQRFCSQLGLRRRLQRQVQITQRNPGYAPADLILALLFVIIAGLRRINKTEILQYNGTFLSLLGLERFPDQSTLRRFLKRLSPPSIRQIVQLHDQLRQRLFTSPRSRSSLTFDLNSVVVTVYGRQQGARVGYNPKKHGRRSYHPLLCFEAHCQEFLHGSLRSGDAAVSTGVVAFVQRCLAKAPKKLGRSRIRFRATRASSAIGSLPTWKRSAASMPLWPSVIPSSNVGLNNAGSAKFIPAGKRECFDISRKPGESPIALSSSVVPSRQTRPKRGS